MLDTAKRQELVHKLRNRIKQASSNVSTKVEAEKGQYKIIISKTSIDHFFDGEKIAAIRVAELDDSLVELINSDPQDAAQEILGEFVASFDAEEMEKEAAHATLDTDTSDKITQKQFDDQKTSLHPRWEDYYTNITQRQLPEHGQRPGTYDIITQGQFRDERTTFYGVDRTAGDWKQEDRNTVTEDQFNQGVDDYTDVGASERGEIGSKYDGGLEKQHKQTGEKQLMELLRHHKWTEPLTVTEGKDQLPQQDGELARLTAEIAGKIIKEALDAFGKTVISVGITPQELAGIASRLVSDETKYRVLADTLKRYAEHDVSVINKKIAKARHFGKTANTGTEWSEFLAADVLIRQLAKIAYDPRHIVEGLVAMAADATFADRINDASDQVLANSDSNVKESENTSVFQQVLAGREDIVEGDDSDGRYAYAGPVEEVVEATGVKVEDKDEFAKAAAQFASEKILAKVGKKIELVPNMLDVNTEKGAFEIQFIEASRHEKELSKRAENRRKLAKEAEETPEEEANAPSAATLARREKEAAEKAAEEEERKAREGSGVNLFRRTSNPETVKTAQMGGAGGMPPAAGPDMANPAPPPGGGDMGQPPAGEALSQDPMMGEEEGLGGSEPKPPGSVCPACGGEDVDVDNGEFRCNNCGAEGNISVKLDVAKWPETIQETGDEEQGGFGLGEEEGMGIGAEEAGMEAGIEEGGTTLPNVPVAASFRLTPRILEKLASQEVQFGKVCPSCGSSDTEIDKSATHKGNDGICWECMQEFNVQVKMAKGKKNRLYGQYIWQPMTSEASCSGCNRLRTAFITSLNDYGMSWGEFGQLRGAAEQGEIILKMAKAGTLDLEAAMQEPLPLKKIAASARWKGYDKFDKFPSASCMERIARRFGENATAMSGPCEGKPLANCVCGQLSSMGIYSDGLAAKVASMQANKNPMVSSPMKTCVAMLVRDNNMDVGDACTVCDSLRAAYASAEELVIESIAQINPLQMKPMRAKPMHAKPMPAPSGAMDPATKTPKLPGGGQAKPMMAPPTDPIGAPGMAPKPMEAPGMGAPGMGAPGMAPKPMGAPGMGAAPADQMLSPMPKPMAEPGAADPMADPSAGPMGGSPLGDPMGEPGGMKQMPDIPQPMDDVITNTDEMGMDMAEDNGTEMDMSIEMDGGFDDMDGGFDEMANDDLIGLGDEGITIQLPPDAMEALQVLFDALQGQLGEGMIDETGDDILDVGDITEDTVEEGEDEEGIPGMEESEEGIPGLVEEEPEGEPEAEGNPFEEPEEKEMLEKHTTGEDKEMEMEAPEAKAKPMPMESKPEIQSKPKPESRLPFAETEGQVKEASLDDELYGMKRGTIKTYQNSLDSVFGGLLAQAEAAAQKTAAKSDGDVKKMEYKGASEGEKIKATPVQETDGIGKIKDGGSMGHEDSFTTDVKSKPDVPRAQATLGDETADITISETGDLPTVPHGSPLMAGEQHFKPEKGNVVDGNQGGGPMTSAAASKKPVKTAATTSEGNDMANTKTARIWTVSKDHKFYAAFMKKADAGEEQVKLTDGMIYDLNVDQNENVVLIAKFKPMEDKQVCEKCDKCPCTCGRKAQNYKKIKESQTVTTKNVRKLEDDPDLNPSSGPGQGKTHADESHSLGVDEKKPSEGMSEPSVPEAPEGGQLAREHTYTNELDGPEYPAGGGSHPEYDTVEKYDPEKQEQILGKENDIAAMASKVETATKIAGQLLKLNEISIDELPGKVKELSKASTEMLADYQKLITKALGTKGLRRQASKDSVETPFLLKTSGTQDDNKSDLRETVQSMFTLDKRNEDYRKLSDDKGSHELWR